MLELLIKYLNATNQNKGQQILSHQEALNNQSLQGVPLHRPQNEQGEFL